MSKLKLQKDQPTALVTGASSGIGLELTKLLAKDGYQLVIVARERARLLKISAALERAYKVNVHVIVVDLAEESSASTIHAQLRSMGIVPAVLINCAGFGDWGEFEKADLLRMQSMMRVNMSALTSITRLFAADMIKAGGGKILNVASQAAFFPGPLMAVYYASKAYVLSLSRSLAEEFREQNVTVTALCPGPTATQFAKNANLTKSALFKGKLLSARDVAKAGYKGMKKGKRVVLPGFSTKVQTHARLIVPSWLLARIMANHQRRLY